MFEVSFPNTVWAKMQEHVIEHIGLHELHSH